MNKKTFGFILIRIVAAIMLLWALKNNPYGYYIILRWVICAIFAYCAIKSYLMDNVAWIWVFGVNAAVYNPISPLHLGRPIWLTVNIASTILIIVSFFMLKRKKVTSELT